MSFLKPREPRKSVSISVRVRSNFGWGDARVSNVSSRGMMIVSESAPPKGAYIEICRGPYSVVGRIVWANDHAFGIRSQDPIVFDHLFKVPAQKRAQADERNSRIQEQIRKNRSPAPTENEAAHARRARIFDFIVITAIGVGFAIVVVDTAESFFSAPFKQASTTLSRANAH